MSTAQSDYTQDELPPSLRAPRDRASSLVELLQSRFFGRNDTYLSERRHWTGEELTKDVWAEHVRGKERIGIATHSERCSYGVADLDGKNETEVDVQRTWRSVQKLVQMLDAEAGVIALVELTRSGKGWHVYVLGHPDAPPTLEQLRRLIKATLRAMGLPDDGDESKGHPGVFPHPPGAKGVGRSVFLPWSGILNGATGGVFVNPADGKPLAQETALAEATRYTEGQIQQAVVVMETVAPPTTNAECNIGTPTASPERHGDFNIDGWIGKHLANHDLRGPAPWKGGRRWEFSVCPFDPEHTDHSAFIVEMASGALSAGCHHAHCTWTWGDLRCRYEGPRTGSRGESRASRSRMTTEAPEPPHWSDSGNAERLVRDHGEDIRYVHTWGKWIVWNGKFWETDVTGEIVRRSQQTIENLYAEALSIEDPKERKKFLTFALSSENRHRLRCMAELAGADQDIAITHEELDRDPWLLNCANGTLDLRTNQRRPHRRSDLITRCVTVPYTPGAECPTFRAFLKQIFDRDEDLVDYVQRSVGYSLTGAISEQVLFLLHGTGSNGKSTFLEAVRALLGDDYAKHAPFETFLNRKEGAIPNDIARLCGARMVTACEADAGRRMSESLIKSLTGGDRITARFMRQEFFEFTPTFKIWLATNHRPTVWGVDHALWRRLKLIPFNVTIPDQEQDKGLPQKLLAELPGLLNWAVEGCRKWRKDGLLDATAVALATHEYRQDEDLIGDFIEDCCVIDRALSVSVGDLWKAYSAWAAGTGAPELSKRKLGAYLRERPEGLVSKKIGGVRAWRGLGLQDKGR